MISLTPTERLEWLLRNERWAAAHPALGELLLRYEDFLKKTDAPEAEIVQKFLDGTYGSEYLKFDTRFGDLVAQALESIGRGNPFYRTLVV